MDKEKLDLEVRLLALEYMAAHTLSVVYRLAGITPTVADIASDRGYERLMLETIPGNHDPALADHITAELASAIDALMRSAAELKAEWDSSR